MKYKLFFVAVIILGGVFVLFNLMGGGKKPSNDYQACVDNGGQVIESAPRRCIDEMGTTYSES